MMIKTPVLMNTIFHNSNNNNSRTDIIIPTTLYLPGTPLAVYSLCRYNGWTGYCVRIQRASDSATLDVGFGVNGYIDMAAVASFRGASTVTVITWYDQSGNGYDATEVINPPTLRTENKINGIQPISFVNSTGLGSTRLVIPSGLTVNSQSFTMAVAYASGCGTATTNQAIASLGNISSASAFVYRPNSGFQLGAAYNFSNKFPSASKIYYTPRIAQADSLMTGSDATNIFLRNNGTSGNATVVASATMTGGTIGATFNTSDTPSFGSNSYNYSAEEVFAVVIYASKLSATDQATIDTNFGTVFKTNQTYNKKIFFDGDSINAGAIAGAYLYGWPRVAGNLLGDTYARYNVAVAGQTMQTCYTARNTVLNRYDSGMSKNIVSIFAGTNDLNPLSPGGSPNLTGYASTLWGSYLLPYIQACTAVGFKMAVGTMVHRSWASYATEKETERAAYNTLIRDNSATYNYSVMDFAANAAMQNAADTTYFVDGIHPTQAGLAVLGGIGAPVIASL